MGTELSSSLHTDKSWGYDTMVSQSENDPLFDQTYNTDKDTVSFPSYRESVYTSNSPSAAATDLLQLSGQGVTIAEAPAVDHDRLSNPPELPECTPTATVNEVDSKYPVPELVAVDRLEPTSDYPAASQPARVAQSSPRASPRDSPGPDQGRCHPTSTETAAAKRSAKRAHDSDDGPATPLCRGHSHASSVNKKYKQSGEKLNAIYPGPDDFPRRWSELNLRVEQLVTRGGQRYAWNREKEAWVSQNRALNPIDKVISVGDPFDFVVGFTAQTAYGYPTKLTLKGETHCFEGLYAEKEIFVFEGAVDVMLGKPDDSLVGYVN
jgi:hypothetical protein